MILTKHIMVELWTQEGLSNRKITRRLTKAPQTIHNEVKYRLVRQQVAFFKNWINNHPMKLFNYKSPREFLQNG